MNELLLDYLPLVVFMAVALAISLALMIVPFVVAYRRAGPREAVRLRVWIQRLR